MNVKKCFAAGLFEFVVFVCLVITCQKIISFSFISLISYSFDHFTG